MDLTANQSQHSDNESNIVVDLQHVPNDKLDSNVAYQHFFALKKKEDTNTNANKKGTLKKRKVALSKSSENYKCPTILLFL